MNIILIISFLVFLFLIIFGINWIETIRIKKSLEEAIKKLEEKLNNNVY